MFQGEVFYFQLHYKTNQGIANFTGPEVLYSTSCCSPPRVRAVPRTLFRFVLFVVVFCGDQTFVALVLESNLYLR